MSVWWAKRLARNLPGASIFHLMTALHLGLAGCLHEDPEHAFNRRRRSLCMSSDSICSGYPYCPGGTTKRDCLDAKWQVNCGSEGSRAAAIDGCSWLPRDPKAVRSDWVAYPLGCELRIEGQPTCVCGLDGWICTN